MGLRAGWLALFLFVWIFGAFLGSTFEYQNTEAASGMAYSTGTANFTYNSVNVTGAGTTWNQALMAGGLIKYDDEGIWYKISSINSTTKLYLASVWSSVNGTSDNATNKAYTMQASPGWVGTGTAGYATSPASKLDYLMRVSNAIQRIELLDAIPFIMPNSEYFSAAFEVLTWRWSFMTEYEMFYWIFCMPFIVMGVLSMILLVYGILTGNLSF